MLLTIILLFIISWLPLQIAILYSEYRNDKHQMVRKSSLKIEKSIFNKLVGLRNCNTWQFVNVYLFSHSVGKVLAPNCVYQSHSKHYGSKSTDGDNKGDLRMAVIEATHAIARVTSVIRAV